MNRTRASNCHATTGAALSSIYRASTTGVGHLPMENPLEDAAGDPSDVDRSSGSVRRRISPNAARMNSIDVG